MTCIRVPYVNLTLQHQAIKTQLLNAVAVVMDHGGLILGPEVSLFEDRFAAYCGTRYAVGVDNGTSALVLSLRALGIGPGDEVITVPNSFLATAACIAMVSARPVFVDVRDDYNLDPNLVEKAITSRTRAILPVHLTGRPADLSPILEIAQRHNLAVIEDCAQAVGARYHGQHVGSLGVMGCFSLHPLKTLNALGDGGIITTNDPELYAWLRKARNHGLRNRDECVFWSLNCRLDTIQAAMLLVKLEYLDAWTKARRANARFYQEQLHTMVHVPQDQPHEYAVYHTFVIQAPRRDELQQYLLERGIETKIHYPIPIHLQAAAADLGYTHRDFPVTMTHSQHILSLPVYPELTREQLEQTVNAIREFYIHSQHTV